MYFPSYQGQRSAVVTTTVAPRFNVRSMEPNFGSLGGMPEVMAKTHVLASFWGEDP